MAKQIWVHILIAPNILNALKQTNRNCFSNIVITLNMQALNNLTDCGKTLYLVKLVKF